MALEINSEWNAFNKPKNITAKDQTIGCSPKMIGQIKHVYKDVNKRWDKKKYVSSIDKIDV